jgi:mycofactocin system glycosyltransferase
MLLKRIWEPAFEWLMKGRFVPFDHIVSVVNQSDPAEIEIFLNHLVVKGYLEREGVPTLSHCPPVSIIIPVRNRPEEISACLQSLRMLDYPVENVEVIVVDDASDDHTPDVVSRFPVKLIRLKDHKQASFCRNLAAQRATGEILAFLDSDCLADPLWLRELIPSFNDPAIGAVGGIVDSHFHEKFLDRYEKVRSSLNMGSWSRSSKEGDRFFYVPSCNLLVRKEIFIRLGGFKEDLHVGEDVDFCWRLQDQGHHMEYRPVGKVNHKHRNQLRHFCARRFDYGTSEPLLQQSHPKRVKQFLLLPGGALFWLFILLFAVSEWVPLMGLGATSLLVDSLLRFHKIRKSNVPIIFPRLLWGVLRSYIAFLYHCCAFVSRYYLWLSVPCFPWLPHATAVILGMHLLTGIGEYLIKKPSLNLPLFLFYFSLDQCSYQLGVWWGCLKRMYFGPVNPQIVRKPAS